MEQQPHAFRQAGVLRLGAVPVYFEVALRDAAAKLGRPPPEIRGYRQDVPEYSERSWRVECTLRGRQVAPICDDCVFEVTARSWEDGLLRVMQLTMARLANDFADRLQDCPLRFIGRRDDQGRMAPADQHPDFLNYFSHVEYLLQHTQQNLDELRTRFDFQQMDCWMHTRQKTVWQRKCKKAERERNEYRSDVRALQRTISRLNNKNKKLEDRVEELEEKTAELLKENDLLADDDAAEPYEMDLEDDDPSDHDEDVGEESADESTIPYEDEEEDPEECVFGSGTESGTA
jgi:hypothetical protein